MKHLLLGICCITSSLLQAQKILRGQLLSADDKKPVAAASVYLSNTSVGTVSKEDGSFVINPFPEGRYDLVVSRQGYITHTQMMNAGELPNELLITLKPRIVDLQEVVIQGYIKNGWKTWGSFFMDYLIGRTPNAQDCKLLNKEAVRFRLKQDQNVLEAVSSEPLIIENKALGYILTYDLELFYFNLSNSLCVYQGYPLFTEMEAPNEKTKQVWQNNRHEAYQGSLMHFMRSLYHNQLAEEGFIVKILPKKQPAAPEMEWMENLPIKGDSIAQSIDTTTVELRFTDLLQVMYPAKKASRAYVKAMELPTLPPGTSRGIEGLVIVSPTGPKNKLRKSFAVGQPVTSQLLSPDPNSGVMVLYNGHYYFSNNLIAMLYWSWSEKLSNLLPLDYGNPIPTNAQLIYKPQ